MKKLSLLAGALIAVAAACPDAVSGPIPYNGHQLLPSQTASGKIDLAARVLDSRMPSLNSHRRSNASPT
jgi:hypothetical protein